MKTRIICALVLVATLVIGCKDEKSVDNLQVVDKEVETKGFKVTFNAIVDKDDIFQIFYNEDGSEVFDGKQIVTINVKGKAEAQDLVFIAPEGDKPVTLRFDLGANKELTKVPFTSFKLEYQGKTFEAKGAEIFKYFYPNGSVKCDTLSATAITKLADDASYDPIIGATPALKAEIAKLYGK